KRLILQVPVSKPKLNLTTVCSQCHSICSSLNQWQGRTAKTPMPSTGPYTEGDVGLAIVSALVVAIVRVMVVKAMDTKN
ncbi:hypothetical protein BGZ95_007283, partial [Linnemannia exigua]